MVVSKRLATFAELDTVYGIEDVEDMIDIILVDGHNERVMAKHLAKDKS